MTDTGFNVTTGNLNRCASFNTFFWIDPADQLAGILMTQDIPYGAYPSLIMEFKALIYQSIIT